MSQSENELGIRRILVCVDGSETAKRAVEVASEIAKNSNAELTILHVIIVPNVAYHGYAPMDKIEEEARREGQEFLDSAAASVEKKGIKAKMAIIRRMDSPARGIIEYVEKNMMDLIVVGTRGLGGFKRLLLGSVATSVVHYAHCSVVVVRPERAGDPLRVLCGEDEAMYEAMSRFLFLEPKREIPFQGDPVTVAQEGKKFLEEGDRLAAYGSFEKASSVELYHGDEKKVREYLQLAEQVASREEQRIDEHTLLKDLSKAMEIAREYYRRIERKAPQ